MGLLLATQREDERGRPEERRRVRREHDLRARHGEQQPAERRPEERADALDRARGDVRCGELGRRPHEPREQRGLGRTEHGADDLRDGDRRVDDRRRAVRSDDPRGDEHQREAREVARDHDPDAREAVDERRRERRRQRGGHQPDQPDDADGRRAALIVRVDAERDEIGPAAEDRARPRELEAAKRRAGKDRAERRERRPASAARLGVVTHLIATTPETREDFTCPTRLVG